MTRKTKAWALVLLAALLCAGCGTSADVPQGMRTTPGMSSSTLNTMTARRQATIERNKDK
ncbi:hypothetical protein CWRG_01437 [Chthonomonas calidirosea]|uniref:hypothetical protein n=1 Tax=Chthonomonas calidirosea TaxID=454171 RepID=UPI0006DD5312|nr:hypothetical protein [Chthonomonas calidirosea]CEK16277.1 hypothetical protein CP488_01454 [Chthonomonas calidirosea]CEK16278.1 hypothetical protein CWRG_01437 [Chthonomonas calidirosea]